MASQSKHDRSVAADLYYDTVSCISPLAHWDAGNWHVYDTFDKGILEKSVASLKKPYANARRRTHVFAAFGYTIGYISGYMAHKEATGYFCQSLPDALKSGEPRRNRTYNPLIKSLFQNHPHVSISVFYGFLLTKQFRPQFAIVRPFSLVWLHDWLHDCQDVQGFLKHFLLCTCAYFSVHFRVLILAAARHFFPKRLTCSLERIGHFVFSECDDSQLSERPP